MKKFLSLILALALTASIAGCSASGGTAGSQDTSAKQQVSIGLSGYVDSFDPIKVSTIETMFLMTNIYEPLVRTNAQGEPAVGTGMAQSMDVNDDYTQFTFHLRNDAAWSNGDPVTAQDYLYAAQRFLDPQNAAPAAQQLLTIKNAYAVYTGQAELSDLGMQAVDDHTLVLTFETPVVNIEEIVYQVVFVPQNQKFIESCADAYASTAENTISCGPYQISALNGTDSVSFVKNESYWDAANVQLSTLNYQSVPNSATRINLFANGELDWVRGDISVSTQYKGAPEEHIVSAASAEYLAVNNAKVTNANVRKALALAIDRESLIESIAPLASSPVGVGCICEKGPEGKTYGEAMSDADFVRYDPQQAAQLLAAGLNELGITAQQLSQQLTILSDPSTENASTYIASELEKNLGLTIAIETVSAQNGQTKLLSGEYTLCPIILSFSSDPLQPLSLYSSQSLYAFSFFKSDAYDALYADALMDATDSRYAILSQMEQLLADQAVVIPLYNESWEFLANDRLSQVIVPVNMTLPDAKYLTVE